MDSNEFLLSKSLPHYATENFLASPYITKTSKKNPAGKFAARGQEYGAKRRSQEKVTLFFGMIYVFVAALAISQALETFNEKALDNMLLLDSMSEGELTILLTLIGFFVTAIPFVHAGVIYLATDATEMLTKGNSVSFSKTLLFCFCRMFFISLWLLMLQTRATS